MRLIDADKLIENMEDTWDMQDLYLPIHFKELLIDEQPTEFDVDKVVKGLENEKDRYTRNYNISKYKEYPEIKLRYECICIAIDKAIDLVKAGGV